MPPQTLSSNFILIFNNRQFDSTNYKVTVSRRFDVTGRIHLEEIYLNTYQQNGINKPERVFTKIAPDNQRAKERKNMFVPSENLPNKKPKLISLKEKCAVISFYEVPVSFNHKRAFNLNLCCQVHSLILPAEGVNTAP